MMMTVASFVHIDIITTQIPQLKLFYNKRLHHGVRLTTLKLVTMRSDEKTSIYLSAEDSFQGPNMVSGFYHTFFGANRPSICPKT